MSKNIEERVEDLGKKQLGNTKYYIKTEGINSEIETILNEEKKHIFDNMTSKEKTQVSDFFHNSIIAENFCIICSKCKRANRQLILDIRISIIGVKLEGERLRFYSDKMGNLKFSKLNEMYDISKENMDFEPIYKAIDSVNNFFAIHKDEVILNQTTDYQMKQDVLLL